MNRRHLLLTAGAALSGRAFAASDPTRAEFLKLVAPRPAGLAPEVRIPVDADRGNELLHLHLWT